MTSPIPRRAALGLAALAPFILPRPAAAQAPPAAAQQAVEQFHAALLQVMREAQRLGTRGRYDRLSPVMAQAFDLAAMTRISVGPPWSGFSAQEQAALLDAFARWCVATYANRFDGFSGESFQTLGVQQQPNGDALVRTQLNRTGGQEPVALSYLMRGNPPRVVDIFLTGTISELASRRAEFTGLIREGGAARVVQELNARASRLLG
ncbi:MAG: ABC transporter substrate-binding protein [Acetobacteraceae bacterium]|nr:ABC transporter substrate-binding protein [Acetobacteraceae bacterium]